VSSAAGVDFSGDYRQCRSDSRADGDPPGDRQRYSQQ
jgi:hypothetical protein